MSVDDKWLLIRKYDLWAHLTDEEYEELNIVPNFIEAPKGDYIYFEAFHHNKLYFVKEGYIRIGFIDDSGKEVIKEIIQKGELFGQITLEKGSLNGEFAQAYKTGVSLCAFSIDDFQKLLQKKPSLALKYSKQVGSKFRQVENRLMNLLNKDVKSRLLDFLWQLAQKHADPTANTACIPNYLTHEDIANLIGSSRQTVTTFFNELATNGLITYNRQEICFPDVKKIQNPATVA
ncbi:MAG: Crp/Fnr family transcriptional regulator [Niastella sp.]|uniref:Crp/Fnr family transcriptional regulator n=1 Tax=Niastella sp. TaxID=1869183 RepID=UPI003899DE2B